MKKFLLLAVAFMLFATNAEAVTPPPDCSRIFADVLARGGADDYYYMRVPVFEYEDGCYAGAHQYLNYRLEDVIVERGDEEVKWYEDALEESIPRNTFVMRVFTTDLWIYEGTRGWHLYEDRIDFDREKYRERSLTGEDGWWGYETYSKPQPFAVNVWNYIWDTAAWEQREKSTSTWREKNQDAGLWLIFRVDDRLVIED